MRRNRLAAACGVVVVLGAVLAARGPRDAEILEQLKGRVDAQKNVGMVVGTIAADGKTSMAAYGSPGPGSQPLDADSIFEIGSITKVFTAILLADMADRGEVKLDDPIANYLPKTMRVPEKNGRKITLLDLSMQVSGLPRMPDNFKPSNLQNPYVDYTVEQMYEFLSRHELRRDPGAQFEYSNLGVGLLGHVLTLRAGKPYERLVKERILDPLDMEHTGIALTPWMQQHLVKGHNAKGEVVSNWDVGVLGAAGALRSNLTDMLKFARANLQAKDRLTRVMQRTHAERASAGNPSMFIGMNWIIRRVDGQDITWHNGGTAGYRTWMGFDAKRKTAAVVLTNSAHGADDLGFALLK